MQRFMMYVWCLVTVMSMPLPVLIAAEAPAQEPAAQEASQNGNMAANSSAVPAVSSEKSSEAMSMLDQYIVQPLRGVVGALQDIAQRAWDAISSWIGKSPEPKVAPAEAAAGA